MQLTTHRSLAMTPEDVPGGISLEQLVPLMRSLELRPAQAGLRVVSDRGRAANARTRTVTWSDPATVAGLLGERDGVAGLDAIAAGQIPPPPVAARTRRPRAWCGAGRRRAPRRRRRRVTDRAGERI